MCRRLQDRGAIQILFVPELNVLVTISHDSCMRLLDPATFGLRNILPHPESGTFTAVACHVGHAEVTCRGALQHLWLDPQAIG